MRNAWSYLYDVMDEILLLGLIIFIYYISKENPS